MSNRGYIDYKLIEQHPNKYNLTPKNINKLKILDWSRLQKKTWYNQAMKDTGEWYCHLEGVGKGYYGDSMSDFWIGFNKKNDKIDCWFDCMEGMCSYNFEKFYDINAIENKYDMEIQVKAIKWLNQMIDDGILGVAQAINVDFDL